MWQNNGKIIYLFRCFHGTQGASRFSIFFRCDGVSLVYTYYMGWERKKQKLERKCHHNSLLVRSMESNVWIFFLWNFPIAFQYDWTNKGENIVFFLFSFLCAIYIIYTYCTASICRMLSVELFKQKMIEMATNHNDITIDNVVLLWIH